MQMNDDDHFKSTPHSNSQLNGSGGSSGSIEGVHFSKQVLRDDDKRRTWKIWIKKRLPFRSEIAQIEAEFGSSVKSYFVFLRFV